MGTPITGTFGSIKATTTGQVIAEITNWSLSSVAAVRSFQSNATSGYRKRAVGGKDNTGEMTYLLDVASASSRRKFEEGDSFTATFAIDASFTHCIILPIVIESVDTNCDIDGDGLVGGRVRFGGNGAPSFTGAFAVNMDITSSS